MNNLADMIWVEMRKAIRSRMPLWTALGSLFMPLGMAFLIYVAKNPEISLKLGLVSAKANLVAYAATDWPAFLSLFGLIIAMGGYFLSVLAMSWVFGREFSDGTVKDLLAVPVQRGSILLAKFIVLAIWSAMLTIVILIAGLVIGAILNLPGGSFNVVLQGSFRLLITACMVMAVIIPFALIASVGRGYLLPLGTAILLVVMANVLALAGWGEYFPWAVPAIFAQGKDALPPVSILIVILTGLAGMAGTYLWWKYADQNR